MIENSVVLPAPFGPISAVMRPASAVSDASLTASTPPKRLRTCSTRSSGSAMRPPRNRRAQACPAHPQVRQHADDAARGERHDQDQHAAIDDEIEPRRIAGDELRQLAQRLDHQGAEQRPEHRSDAADDRRQQGFDRNPRSVGDTGIDEQEILRIEGPTGGRHGGRNRDGGELDPHGVHAERFRGLLVLTHRDEPGTEPAVLDQTHDDQRHGDQCQGDPIKRRAALELERLRPQVEREQEADAGTGDGSNTRANPQHLGKCESDEGEIRTLQPGTKGEHADDGANHGAAGDPECESEPSIDAVARLQDRRDIGASAEEGGMTEGILPAIAAEHVPALSDQRDQQRDSEEIKDNIGGREQRHDRKKSDDDEDMRDRPSLHAGSPNRPLGRTSSTRMNMMKIPICPSDSPKYRPQRDSTTPTNRPPASAPVTEPMPPSTTMVKATSTKALPTCGLT